MKYICLYFQVHQPIRLRNYSFFDIGNDHHYYNNQLNEEILAKVARKCYLPANKILVQLLKKSKYPFKITFSISGVALDQFELYAPEVIDSFKQLADTGKVEFLAETYSHSLASQVDFELFNKQVHKHAQKIEKLFGQKPTVFRNTELIYSDQIGFEVFKMGYKAMLTEGADHILGWQSPNYLYHNPFQPNLKILLRNFNLSDNIAFRFSDKNWSGYPLTPKKFSTMLNNLDSKEELVNLFIDYETFGEHQWIETGIFKFLMELPKEVLTATPFTFETPSQIIKKLQPVAPINVPYPISWADQERDLTAWLGNEIQQEAFQKLYSLKPYIANIIDPELLLKWEYLQSSDHFYYMSTKWFTDGAVHAYFNPYSDPYEAFLNYMNVLNDFTLLVKNLTPSRNELDIIQKLNHKVLNQQKQIEQLKEQLHQSKKK